MSQKGLEGWYGSERIPPPRIQRSPAEQLALLNWHPIFTGRCPNFEVPITQKAPGRERWECGGCGWLEDSNGMWQYS